MSKKYIVLRVGQQYAIFGDNGLVSYYDTYVQAVDSCDNFNEREG